MRAKYEYRNSEVFNKALEGLDASVSSAETQE
jgi:hypothetical protein